jgi:hypothetical protein
MVLPLPLTAFEEYMLVDSRPAYPMDGFLRLRFSGRFEGAALSAALAVATQRHPLLAAQVRRGRWGRWEWYPAPDGPAPIRWLAGPAGDAFPPVTRPIDLTAESGVRVVVVESTQQSDLVLHIHHACCDGLGAFQFATELLVAYAQAVGAPLTRPWDPLPEIEKLRKRGTFGITPGKLLRLIPAQLMGLTDVGPFLRRVPVPLLPVKACPDDESLPAGYPAAVFRHLKDSELSRLRSTASQQGVTCNDLLLRDLFLTLDAWRQQQSTEPGSTWIRVSVPINLRKLCGLTVPAANVVSMVFLDRCSRELVSPAALLRGIHEEMDLIKRRHLALTFVLSLQVARRLPGGLARADRADRCSATTVLSNFGAPLAEAPFPQRDGLLEIAGLVLEKAEAMPPWRPYTSAVFVTINYGSRLAVGMHYDPRVLAASQAGALLDGFVERLRGEGTECVG